MDIIQLLEQRAEKVKAELDKFQEKVATLSHSLQEAQAGLHAVNGHYNEVKFLLSEAHKQMPKENDEGLQDDEANNEATK